MSLLSRLLFRLGYVNLREHDLVIGRDGRAEPRIKPLPGYSFMRSDGFTQTEPAFANREPRQRPPNPALVPRRRPSTLERPEPAGKQAPQPSAHEVRKRLAAGTRPAPVRRPSSPPMRDEEAEWERLLAEARARAEQHRDDLDIPIEEGDTWVSPAPVFRNEPYKG